MEITKCPKGDFNKYVSFMLSFASFKCVFNSPGFRIVEDRTSKSQYAICLKHGVVVGYVFHGKLVIPEEV